MAHWYIGTSIGAFIGGLYAREGDIIASTGRAKQFCRRMGNIWRILSDVTYPIVAYTTVRQVLNLIKLQLIFPLLGTWIQQVIVQGIAWMLIFYFDVDIPAG